MLGISNKARRIFVAWKSSFKEEFNGVDLLDLF